MAAPTSPFSSTKQIAYLVLNLFPNADISDPDFDASTTPSLTVVQSLRTLKSAEILMAYSAVGYYVPFQEISGVSWPTHQTNFLAMLEAQGVAGQLANSLRPAPAMAGTKGPSTNILDAAFKGWLDIIEKSGAGLRANYYPGSKAEKWLASPRAPQTEYTIDYPDPAKFGLLIENLSYLQDQFDDIAKRNLDWDYIYSLR